MRKERCEPSSKSMLTSVSEFKEVTVATAVFNYHIALLKGAGDESVVRVVRVVVLGV